jgi:hypothetical protein
LPPLEETEEELLVAKVYEGICRGCDLDIQREKSRLMVDDETAVVPLRGWRNRMDPCWNFPQQELRRLFEEATLNEVMFVSLEHMQIDYVTVRMTQLDKFRKNVISFPQDVRSFVEREGMLQHYKVNDRVNSVRGPGSGLERAPVMARDASEDWRRQYAEDAQGRLVFPGTVKGVEGPGIYKIEYDYLEGDSHVERREHLAPRLQMPWHPQKLQGKLVIMLTRNVKYGEPIEGLEVRWDYVCNLLQALVDRPDVYRHMRRTDGTVAPWREGGEVDEPMHRWYDMRTNMFDVLSEKQCRRLYAPRIVDDEVLSPEEWAARMYGEEEDDDDDPSKQGVNLRTAADFMAAHMDVRLDGGDAQTGVGVCVDRDDFQAWLVLKGLEVASELLKWWNLLDEVDELSEVDGFAKYRGDTVADFYEVVRANAHERGWLTEGARFCRWRSGVRRP